MKLRFLFLVLFGLLVTLPPAEGQNKTASAACGKAKIQIANPKYLVISSVIVAAEPPNGWDLDATKTNPFYFLKTGEKYESAKTLMYVNIERLDDSLQNAVQRDEQVFRKGCPASRIEETSQPEILEQGCERKTQLFYCEKINGAYVDLVTKISINGLVIDVVLSADNAAEIARYRQDYEQLLNHLALVN
jgi:hypothetical protein